MTFVSAQSKRDAAILRAFGELYDYIEVGHEPRPVTGVFEHPTRQSGIGERPMAGVYPMISVLSSEVPNLRADDQFEIAGDTYRVKAPRKDEGGIVTGYLEKL